MLRLNEQLRSPYTYEPQDSPVVRLLDVATLGDGAGNVECADKVGFLYIRMHNSTATAWNMANVPAVEGLQVIVERIWTGGAGQGYLILGRMFQQSGDPVWGTGYVGDHARQHEIDDINLVYGHDTVSVSARMIVPCRAIQTPPTATMEIYVQPGFYNLQGIQWWGGGLSPTFAAPTANPRYDLLYINSAGALAVALGAEAQSPAYPDTPSNCVPICYVYLVVGQTEIVEADIRRDARAFISGSKEAPDASGVAATIHAATGKATPVDTDETALADSAASYGLKKLTWANQKATLYAAAVCVDDQVVCNNDEIVFV